MAIVMEGSSTSVFVVKNGVVATPPNSHRILPGTTRDATLSLANNVMPVEIRTISIDELRAADEGVDFRRDSRRPASDEYRRCAGRQRSPRPRVAAYGGFLRQAPAGPGRQPRLHALTRDFGLT